MSINQSKYRNTFLENKKRSGHSVPVIKINIIYIHMIACYCKLGWLSAVMNLLAFRLQRMAIPKTVGLCWPRSGWKRSNITYNPKKYILKYFLCFPQRYRLTIYDIIQDVLLLILYIQIKIDKLTEFNIFIPKEKKISFW